MWLDILRLFPQVTVMGPGRFSGNGGRAKRSATFPGIRNLGTNFMSPASRFANNKAANANAALVKSSKTDEDYEEEDEEQEEEDEDDELGLFHLKNQTLTVVCVRESTKAILCSK